MITTIKVNEETKKRLLRLDLAGKGKSFDMVINELITSYEKFQEAYNKDVKEYRKKMKVYDNETKIYEERVRKYESKKKMWDNLLKWAKSKGFKG